jgi:hypothetical protein
MAACTGRPEGSEPGMGESAVEAAPQEAQPEVACAKKAGTVSGAPVLGSACKSPVGLCLKLTLTGDLKGSVYEFAASSNDSANDPAHPGRRLVVGTATVTSPDGPAAGQYFTEATGFIDVNLFGTSPFQVTNKIVKGTGAVENATGGFAATGEASFGFATIKGNYDGEICSPGR